MKRDGADRNISEASATQSLGEVGGLYSNIFFETCPQWWKPWLFFPDKTKKLIGGFVQKKETGRTILHQRQAHPPGLGKVGRSIRRKKIETCPRWRKPLRFFSRQDKNIVKGGFPKK